MRAWGSAASVIAAIVDDAAAQIERLDREADEEKERRRAVHAQAPLIDPEPPLALARRNAAELDLEQDWQDALADARDRDEWIATVIEAGRSAVVAAGDVVPWTGALVIEAVRHLPGCATAVVTVPAAVLRVTGDDWREALEAKTGRPLILEPGSFAAGCIARTGDGRVSFDNRLEAREARTASEWRAALVHRYDVAVAQRPAVGAV